MTLVTLDLGAVTGWAKGPAGGHLPATGYWRMASTGDDIGAYLQAAQRNLRWLMRGCEGELCVAFEQPILVRAQYDADAERASLNTNITTLRKLYSYAGLVELLALEAGATVVREIPVGAVKKALTGSGAATKLQMVEAYEAHQMRWPEGLRYSERHNVADAFGIWVMMAGKLNPAAAAERTPLFAAGARA